MSTVEKILTEPVKGIPLMSSARIKYNDGKNLTSYRVSHAATSPLDLCISAADTSSAMACRVLPSSSMRLSSCGARGKRKGRWMTKTGSVGWTGG